MLTVAGVNFKAAPQHVGLLVLAIASPEPLRNAYSQIRRMSRLAAPACLS
jgi:hypothetical protein